MPWTTGCAGSRPAPTTTSRSPSPSGSSWRGSRRWRAAARRLPRRSIAWRTSRWTSPPARYAAAAARSPSPRRSSPCSSCSCCTRDACSTAPRSRRTCGTTTTIRSSTSSRSSWRDCAARSTMASSRSSSRRCAARATASAREGSLMQPLARLRLQLTAWYAGVFTLVLALLGAGLFLTIRHQMSRHVDRSLSAAAAALEQAARIRETERASARGAVVDAVDELHIPDRSLYLLDENERPIKPAEAPGWVLEATHQAVRSKHGYRNLDAPDGRELRIYAGRFTGTTGTPYIAAVVADRDRKSTRLNSSHLVISYAVF